MPPPTPGPAHSRDTTEQEDRLEEAMVATVIDELGNDTSNTIWNANIEMMMIMSMYVFTRHHPL